MKVRKRWILAEELGKTWGLPFGERLQYFMRMGWKNVPEFMVGLPVIGVCSVGLIYCMYRFSKNPVPLKYHGDIKIYRPGDPRIADIPKVAHFDP